MLEDIVSQPEPIMTPTPQAIMPIQPTPQKSNVLPIVLAVLLTFTSTAAAFFGYQYFTKARLNCPTLPRCLDIPNNGRGEPYSTWKTYSIQQLNR